MGITLAGHPEVLGQLRREPNLVIRLVEELLRYEPPVQMLSSRTVTAARLETQVALTALVRRLERPRLVQDPPPYRQSATLRGPHHLLVDVDGVLD